MRADRAINRRAVKGRCIARIKNPANNSHMERRVIRIKNCICGAERAKEDKKNHARVNSQAEQRAQ